MQKSVLTILSAVLLLTAVLCTAGCISDNQQSDSPSVTCGVLVKGDSLFLDINTNEFNRHGFTLGDEVTLSFSNGKICEHTLYLPGFVAKNGEWVIVPVRGENKPVIGIQTYGNVLATAGVSEGDTATVTLESKGKYAYLNVLAQPISANKSDFTSDEVFANFRPVIGGKIKDNVIYRGTSPVDNSQNRSKTVGDLLQKYEIRTILDLSDSEDKVLKMMEDDKDNTAVFTAYYTTGDVVFADLENNYNNETFAKRLIPALKEAFMHPTPVYIHCVKGRDRTGFVCMLIEALCGASYEEMKTDYLKSYENFCSIETVSQPDLNSYLTNEKFEPILAYIAGVPDGTDVSSLSQDVFVSGAKQYLKAGGMSDAEIEELIHTICEE